MLASLLMGCHASLLMNNGEISRPQANKITKDTVEEFNKELAPTNVNATASFYTDKIRVRWKEVKGADYYTIEKTSHLEPTLPEDATWVDLGIGVTGTSYEDNKNLQPSTYYSYRITPHTYIGQAGAVSKSSTGTILSSPVKIDASKGTDLQHIYLTWDQTPNAEEYKIYKSTSSTILGTDSEYVTTVEVNENSLENVYAYEIIPGKEEGKDLYFALSATNNGVSAPLSIPRSGFTKVLGAPQKPLCEISKGEYTNLITIQFISPTEDATTPFDYVIKRSYPGSTEAEVFSTKFGDALVKNENGYYVFEDTDVYDNVEYSYSIMATDSKGNKSEAVVDTGYVLSPVKNLMLKASEQDSGIGYKATFDLPVGSDNPKYVYKVTATLKNGDIGDVKEIKSADIANSDLFYQVQEKLKEASDELKEIRSISIVVSNGEYETTPVVSNSIKDLDFAITKIGATHNEKPLNSDTPNEKGVYPVYIEFETKSNNEQTLVRKGSDGSVTYFEVTKENRDSKRDYVYVYVDVETVPLVTYDYYIDNTDELGRTIGGERNSIQHTGSSYGSITPELYKAIFESVSLKPWEKQDYVPKQYQSWWKSTSLAVMIGYGNASDLSTQMKALGDAQANDHSSRSGLCRYSASMEGMGGQIYFYYTNFGESENFYITGNYEMHVNASGNGSAGSNTNGFEILGMYPGRCSLANIKVVSKGFSGKYGFEYNYTDGSGFETVKFEVGV